MEIVMYKSLKIASILLATTSLYASPLGDGTAMTGRLGIVRHVLQPSDAENPGALLDSAGTRSNSTQSYESISAGLKMTKGRYHLVTDVHLQPMSRIYANPTGNVTASIAALVTPANNGTTTAITLNGAANNVVGAGTTQSATSTIDLIITGGGTDTVKIKADTGGKMERDNSLAITTALMYEVNEHSSMGFYLKAGESDQKIGGAEAKVVSEFSAGFTYACNIPNGFSVETSASLIANAQAKNSDLGNKQDMLDFSVAMFYNMGL